MIKMKLQNMLVNKCNECKHNYHLRNNKLYLKSKNM